MPNILELPSLEFGSVLSVTRPLIVTRVVTWYNRFVIKSFKHRGLRRFFETGSTAGINAQHASRIRLLLARLNVSRLPKDMDAPGFFLHELKGRRKGTWSVRVNKNWRVTFMFDGPDVHVVDYEDYH